MGNSGQKETEIVSSNPPVKYRRGKSESGTSPEARAIVEEIFAREPNRSVVSVSWVQRARSRGAEYEAGVTWLSAIIDQKHFYAFVPKHGMFEMPADSGQVWLFLELYPAQGRDDTGLPVLRISKKKKPTGKFVKLLSPKMEVKTTMCMSRHEELADGTIALRFATLL